MSRLFSEAELAEMAKRTVDRVCAAIDAGDDWSRFHEKLSRLDAVRRARGPG